jgi:DNA uptake protein ComE-like DNA-binding protein
MKKSRKLLLAVISAVLVVIVPACSSRSQNAQSQRQQDQKMRQQVADATQKVKAESEVAARKADEASHELEHKAKVAAQGVKEGWNRNASQKINLNSASRDEMEHQLGLSRQEAQRIINGRPYHEKSDLVKKGIVSDDEYAKIHGQITVHQNSGG